MAIGDHAVTVVGDLMLDVNLHVTERPNAEGALSCLHGHKFQYFPGGAANVVHLIKEIGEVHALIRGVVGEDWAGRILKRMLYGCCAAESGGRISTTDAAPTTVKIRAYSEGRIVSRIDQEWIVLDRCPRVLLGSLSSTATAFVDYGKGVFSDRQMIDVRRIIDADEQITVVNPCPSNPQDWSGATVCVLNEIEHGILGFTGAQWTLITRGDKGASLYHHEKAACDFPVEPFENAQVVGAGDSVTAMLASQLALGKAVPYAAREAVKFSTQYVREPRPMTETQDG